MPRRCLSGAERSFTFVATARLSRKISSNELRCGRKWRTCSPDSAASDQIIRSDCPGGSCTSIVWSCWPTVQPAAVSRWAKAARRPSRGPRSNVRAAAASRESPPAPAPCPAPARPRDRRQIPRPAARWLENSRLMSLPWARSRASSSNSCRPAGSMPLVGSSRISSADRGPGPPPASPAASCPSSTIRPGDSGPRPGQRG